MPQSTYFCVRLADGQLRHAAYGVGGASYSLQEGIELAHGERDALCTNYGITVLGARGQLGTTSGYHAGYASYTPELIEPRARSLGRIGVARCYVDDADKIVCMGDYAADAPALAELLNAEGPVDHMTPDAPCAVYRDGHVSCASENGPASTKRLFTGAVDASIVSPGWSQYRGCALLATGKVACTGYNALALRTFTDPASTTPVEIPGLDGIDEVAVGGGTACARRGGAVWCWGEAAAYQAGPAAFEHSAPMAKCVVDEARTREARAAFEADQRACRDPKRVRGHDDPLCRAMFQASPPGRIFKESATPCDPYDGKSTSRWAPPMRVAGIDDAIAIGSNGRLTCALRAHAKLTCWGNDVRAPQSLTFPARTLPAEHAPAAGAVIAAPSAPGLRVGAREVVVTSASGAHARYALGATLGAGVALPADTTDVLVERHCTLAAGATSCTPDPHWSAPAFPEREPDGVRLSTVWGLGCVLRRDGILRCGGATSHRDGAYAMATALAAVAPIVEQGGLFARYADHTVREYTRTNPYAILVRWRDAIALSAGGSDGATACVVLRGGAVECRAADNRFFQRGDDTTARDVATPITGIPRATAVATSGTHACALGEDGSVWCWGRATNGELGEAGAKLATSAGKDPVWPDTTPTRRTAHATRVPGIDDAVAIGVGDGTSCALLASHELACWGAGSPAVRRVKTPGP
jgi:hypothetical protein